MPVTDRILRLNNPYLTRRSIQPFQEIFLDSMSNGLEEHGVRQMPDFFGQNQWKAVSVRCFGTDNPSTVHGPENLPPFFQGCFSGSDALCRIAANLLGV